ncbi:hypothetical protein IC620_02970 [Hazenella sp. IB182357]|uniref:Cell division protein FtsL n=1 Tax=Polycladospora coralii TaxID=2771432 RepID=A0A926NA00_9BACL|nr:hypothetical protein [Polycladospora coralii]MBD1371315.1 hypothetical protein [Polycladospora coralii]MBS7530283.1 hypothetical protein [Polycladospora coralii]
MRENRWNESVARPLVDSKKYVQRKKKKKALLLRLPVGEKILYLASIIVCVFLALCVTSWKAEVTELKVAISQTETAIQEGEKVNLQLNAEKQELTSVERIRQFAERNNLKLSAPQILPSVQP